MVVVEMDDWIMHDFRVAVCVFVFINVICYVFYYCMNVQDKTEAATLNMNS